MITIKDIAREAGVSHPTVSLVLNGKAKQARISDKVAKKIHETAKKLGYARNEIARSMVTGRNDVIAFVASDMGLIEYTGRIQNGILAELTSRNYSLKLYRIDKDKQMETAKTLIAQRVSGVIFHCAKHEDFADIRKELEHCEIPVAMVNLSNNGETGFGITTDDYQGASDAVKYLAELGHRNIAYLANDSNAEFAVNRLNGYLDGMGKYSSEKPLVLNIPGIEDDSRKLLWFETSIKKLYTQGITAVFCSQDTIAMKLLSTVYSLNIRVPEQLSVIGFGNMDMGKYAVVPLTSVAQPFEEMGKLAAINVIETANKNGAEKYLILKTELIIRRSTSKANNI